MSAPGCSGVIAWCPMCWARSRIPRARAAGAALDGAVLPQRRACPRLGSAIPAGPGPAGGADHRARQERAGVPAQGRRLVGPEHGPSLRRRHHLDAGVRTGPVPGVRPRRPHALFGPAAQHTGEFNSARILDEVWMFGMPVHNPVVMRNKIRVMQMQGSSYIKGLEGLRISPSEGLEVSAAAPRSVSRGRAERQAAAGQVGAPVFRATQAALNKGSQEGFPSRLPFALDARTSRSCLLALLANSIFLVVIKMKIRSFSLEEKRYRIACHDSHREPFQDLRHAAWPVPGPARHQPAHRAGRGLRHHWSQRRWQEHAGPVHQFAGAAE